MLGEDTITIPVSETIHPVKVGMCVDLDNLPVSIIKDVITYDVEDYINMLIDKKLNAEYEYKGVYHEYDEKE